MAKSASNSVSSSVENKCNIENKNMTDEGVTKRSAATKEEDVRVSNQYQKGSGKPAPNSDVWTTDNKNLPSKDKDGKVVMLKNTNAHDEALWRTEYADEFTWSATPEPHAVRRKEIIEKYPEIKELMHCDPWAGLFCVCTVLIQLTMAWLCRDASWYVILIAGYCVSGTLNHSLQLAMHELSHDLFFPKRWQNTLMTYVANIPACVASGATFRRYHLEHHTNQGSDYWDADLPTYLEAKNFQGPAMKALYLLTMPLWYAVRPLLVRPKAMSRAEAMNWVVIASTDAIILYFMGPRSLAYLFAGTVLGLGLHPMSGHFLEHQEFIKGQETYSYYGPLNYLCYNVGYHNEHHDFPRVPGRLLPKIKAIAPEYYDNLPHYTSWTNTLYSFIFAKNVNIYSRVKRA